MENSSEKNISQLMRNSSYRNELEQTEKEVEGLMNECASLKNLIRFDENNGYDTSNNKKSLVDLENELKKKTSIMKGRREQLIKSNQCQKF